MFVKMGFTETDWAQCNTCGKGTTAITSLGFQPATPPVNIIQVKTFLLTKKHNFPIVGLINH